MVTNYKKISTKKIEAFFFYAFLSVNAIFIICNRSNPSLDGPAHLYYSQLINYLHSGNDFIKTYFAINKVPVPNLTDHYLLAWLMSVFSYTVSEKILLLIFIIGFPLSFRYVIKIVNPGCIGLSAFAIVFSQSFLFYLGFHNFCLSFVFLFAALGVYLRYFAENPEHFSGKVYILLFLLIMLTYFTNGLSFGFLALILFLHESSLWVNILRKKIEVSSIKKVIGRTALFVVLWLPALVFLYVYIIHAPLQQAGYRKYPLIELLRWVRDVRPLIVYTYDDQPFTRIIFIVVIIAFFAALYFRIKSRTVFHFLKSDIVLLISAICLAGFFLIPDSASVGMMSVRLCYYFFVFFILWIAMQKGSGKIVMAGSILVVSAQAVLLFAKHAPTISRLNSEIEKVRSAGECIKPNSIVLPIDVTDDWLLLHFADYIGVDKPLAITEYYEASLGWFAVKWNLNSMPKLMLGEKPSVLPLLWTNNMNCATTKQIDYVFVYGDVNHLDEQKWMELKSILDTKYKPVFTSPDGRIHIYGVI